MTGEWSPVTVASVVEGYGEVGALPKILHRIASELGVADRLLTPVPMRVPRGKLTCPGGIERAAAAAAVSVTGAGGVLVVLDADDDCPAQLGPKLLARAHTARPDKRIAVVLANREFEAWYLAATPSFAGKYGFPEPFPLCSDPEKPRDCKGKLTLARGSGFPYKETVDQEPLASVFDMAMARANAPSFGKFYREVAALLGAAEHS
jgi:hypothetical protein